MKWIKSSEKMPNRNTEVIVWFPQVNCVTTYEYLHIEDINILPYFPTHWMYLPKPPKESE